ncbi:hypothetical protein EDM54_19265 [Brevibacillus borstelensis]|uniref:Uncharacterized protein n=1 Tax=Brevibacillus borstelensis AK1 TaxID=1300222 RepID=M8DI96_9BACL|nr:hypothetical protein I532_10077 [Brevibacillus borstelensis AK1]KKX55493.1 hypothetical protein X546_07355 [Brevibacillus borstelensis cifa_chp40]RNB60693.1 hypothetical protein EDM54_19265 [Brevibacillus borstelensis]
MFEAGSEYFVSHACPIRNMFLSDEGCQSQFYLVKLDFRLLLIVCQQKLVKSCFLRKTQYIVLSKNLSHNI